MRPNTKTLTTTMLLIGVLTAAYSPHANSLSRDKVEWRNGDVELRGTLYLPDGKGPFPAFIQLHGSGPETRTAFTATRYARAFAKAGYAYLLYDKRGAGESTGDWLDSDYRDLAMDAVRGMDMLAERRDIDADRIGALGVSEGGWTGPLAASLSPHPSLLILVSAPPMSPHEQGIFELETALRKANASESHIAEAVELIQQIANVRRTGSGVDELKVTVEAAKSAPWYEAAERPNVPDTSSPGSKWYSRIMDYDPLPVLHALEQPTLMFYGAKDPLVDAKTSSRIMNDIKTSHDKDFTIHTYPEGGHNLTRDEIQFPEDHWDRIFTWVGKYWEKN